MRPSTPNFASQPRLLYEGMHGCGVFIISSQVGIDVILYMGIFLQNMARPKMIDQKVCEFFYLKQRAAMQGERVC
jgi:hypothetical protein